MARFKKFCVFCGAKIISSDKKCRNKECRQKVHNVHPSDWVFCRDCGKKKKGDDPCTCPQRPTWIKKLKQSDLNGLEPEPIPFNRRRQPHRVHSHKVGNGNR